MAKLTAPLFSLEATGKLGDDLVVQTWRGRPYCRRFSRPRKNPTPKQRGSRLYVGLFAQLWRTLSPAWLAQWTAYKPGLNIPPFQRFIGYNLDRAALDLAPRLYPGADEPALHCPDLEAPLEQFPLYNRINVKATVVWNDTVAWLAYRSPKPTAPTLLRVGQPPHSTAAMIAALTTESVFFDDYSIEPGCFYYYSMRSVLPTGELFDYNGNPV